MAQNGTHPVTNGHSQNLPNGRPKHNVPSHFIGGNELSRAPSGVVRDFVDASQGHTVITNVNCGLSP